ARIVGIVYNDADQNASYSSGEPLLANVTVRCSNGQTAKTSSSGNYEFVLTPGTYTITEVDPAGDTSTTPNAATVSPKPGDYVQVNFGDHSATGTIRGIVYADANQNATQDAGELGIHGIQMSLDTGASTTTSTSGRYSFVVPIGTYEVTELDSISY